MAQLIALSCVAILAVLASTPSAHVISCHNPDESQLQAQWLEYVDTDTAARGHESFFAVDSPGRSILDDLAVQSQASESWIHGNQDPSRCDLSHIQNQPALQDRSYCPWYNIINQSADRYPHQMAEARCRCQYGAGMRNVSACEAVTYSIRVLRRTNEKTPEGYCKFVPGWMSITVGCTMTKSY